MLIRNVFAFFVCSIFLFLVLSCDKYHAKRLAGTYACTVDYHYWDMTPVVIDSTYKEDIEITQEGKNVVVLGVAIPVDSLWKENEYYQGNVHDYMTVLFRDDSVYITRSSSGLGGGGTLTYSGKKI